jgi:hypothetical protein
MHPLRPLPVAERGFALLVVVFLVLLLAGLSIALVEEGMASKTAVHHHETSLQALEILEAGLARATQEIRAQVDSGTDGIGTVSGELGDGSYSVTATPDAANPDRYVLTGTATKNLSRRTVEVGVRRRATGYWLEGLFSKDSLTFRGNTSTDSYDSRLGTYASQAVNGNGSYALAGGHIGSNGSIDLRGSSVDIRGNAIPGPLHDVQTSGNPLITGDRMPREVAIEIDTIPLAVFQAALANNNNASLLAGNGGPGGNGNGNGNGGGGNGGGNGGGGNGGGGNGGGGNGGGGNGGGQGSYNATTRALSVGNHATLTLQAGTYFFSSINLGSHATLQLAGPVVVYCTGNVDLTGGTVLNTGRPSDFRLFVAPYALPAGHFVAQPEVRLRGGSAITAAIYAPDATLDLGGGCELFGAAVAESVRIHGNCDFHYDNALGALYGGSVATIERLYWRETSPPRR